jgi:steroid delta-isomerase-like uncharacterized protein
MITSTAVGRAEVDRLVDEHFDAEVRQDLDTLLATFADDVEHDVVGSATISHGKPQVEAFYRSLLRDLKLESIENVRRYHGPGFVVDESVVHARAIGRPLGFDGRDRPLTFRLLHVFDIADGRIRRENAWLDTAAIVAQLG